MSDPFDFNDTPTPGDGQTVGDLDITYSRLLRAAMRGAETPWEEGFAADMADRYEEYGERCFITDRQLNKLLSIAGWS